MGQHRGPGSNQYQDKPPIVAGVNQAPVAPPRMDEPTADWHQSKVPERRAAAAGLPDISPEQLESLSRDPDPIVRSVVVQRWDHPLPPHLVDDPHPLVRFGVAQRLDIDEQTRMRLVSDPDVARIASMVLPA